MNFNNFYIWNNDHNFHENFFVQEIKKDKIKRCSG